MSGYPHCPHCHPGCTAQHVTQCPACGQTYDDYVRPGIPGQRQPAEPAMEAVAS